MSERKAGQCDSVLGRSWEHGAGFCHVLKDCVFVCKCVFRLHVFVRKKERDRQENANCMVVRELYLCGCVCVCVISMCPVLFYCGAVVRELYLSGCVCVCDQHVFSVVIVKL